MTPLDWLTIALYFGLLLGLTWWSVLRNRNTADDYFLAGRDLGWVVVGASIFASNIGSEHLVGLAGAGATSGVALAHYELHAWCLLVLGWVMVPFYLRSGVYTMPEFLERRFSAGGALGAVADLARRLRADQDGRRHLRRRRRVRHAAARDAARRSAARSFNSFWIGSVARGRADRALHGARRHARRRLHRGGADRGARARFAAADGLRPQPARRLGRAARGARPEMFNLWKPIVPAGVEGTWAPVKEAGRMAWYFNQNYPWPGMLFCAPIIGLWYWCTDQYIVQRTLGRRTRREARRGTIFAAFLKLLPVFIFIVPGMIARGAGAHRPSAGLGALVDGRGQRGAVGGAGRVSAARAARHAGRAARRGRGRAAGRAHELARRRVQRLVHALHDRLLPEAPAARLAGAAGLGRPRGDGGHGDRSRCCGFR